jgi:hypothetical protein
MDITYYAFATYVFLLICTGLWIFGRGSRSGKKNNKDNKSAYEKEQRLFTLYQNVEDMLGSFEEFAVETKKETEETLKKAARLLEEAKGLSAELDSLRRAAEQSEKTAAVQESPDAPLPETVKPDGKRPAPALAGSEAPLRINEKIALLDAQGLGATDIAKTLGISVREVTLAFDMIRK